MLHPSPGTSTSIPTSPPSVSPDSTGLSTVPHAPFAAAPPYQCPGVPPPRSTPTLAPSSAAATCRRGASPAPLVSPATAPPRTRRGACPSCAPRAATHQQLPSSSVPRPAAHRHQQLHLFQRAEPCGVPGPDASPLPACRIATLSRRRTFGVVRGGIGLSHQHTSVRHSAIVLCLCHEALDRRVH